jgi:predicted TIM-barrel fold metal-dependent hydrolase
MKILSPSVLLAACVLARAAAAQDADPQLLAEILRIRAIDNHSHALPASPPGELPKDPVGAVPFAYPFRLRLDSPEYPQAWAALWSATRGEKALRARDALEAKWRIRREKGDAYPAWVLDQAGIDTAIVNADELGAGQTPPRFRWVRTADALVSPGRDKQKPPPDLARYLREVVTPALERWKAGGALAVKFTLAYRRPLDFAAVTREEAERVYALAAEGSPTPAEGKALQDFLFRFICAEAGRLGLAVHVHVGIGANPYFDLRGSEPTLLEPTLNDPALRETRFVLIHGGWPYERETGAMLVKPNVSADFSAQPFLRSTRALAATLREWLEFYPEKVLFGTDAYTEDAAGTMAPLSGWEEKIWLTTRTSRRALAIALTGMMRDGQVTRAQAVDLARLVLRGNAERLYGLAP